MSTKESGKKKLTIESKGTWIAALDSEGVCVFVHEAG
jgi:hypothetical protein